MAKVIQITPCEGWFHVVEDPSGKIFLTRIAAWGLKDDGEVVGLIPVEGMEINNEPPQPRLVTVPPIKARYLHESSREFSEVKLSSTFQ